MVGIVDLARAVVLPNLNLSLYSKRLRIFLGFSKEPKSNRPSKKGTGQNNRKPKENVA